MTCDLTRNSSDVQSLMRVVFPADYFKSRQPDGAFTAQVEAFVSAGFKVSVWDENARTLTPTPEVGETVFYRGWMMTPQEYAELAQRVIQVGARMFTTPEQYVAAHYLPNWYPLIPDLTPETVCFTELEGIQDKLKKLGWDGFFVKDFVKSLKTSLGSRLEHADAIDVLMAEMEKFRGRIEGGLCVRRLEDFRPETEQRFFVLSGVPHSPIGEAVPELVRLVAEKVHLPFYSVDIIQRTDGVWRVVEIGDGQVSDLIGWDTETFVNVWKAEQRDKI